MNSKAELQAILDRSPNGLVVINHSNDIVFANPAAAAQFGAEPNTLVGTKLPPECTPGQATAYEHSGHDNRTLEMNGTPLEWRGEPATLVAINDITQLKTSENKLADYLYQDNAIADLGDRALETDSLTELWGMAAQLVHDTLNVEFSAVLAYQSATADALMVAGSGWDGDPVNDHTVPLEPGLPAGKVLLEGGYVAVSNWQQCPDFVADSLLSKHNVMSSVSVVIPGRGGSQVKPWRVLGAYSTRKRTFESGEINHLRHMANVLANAMQHVSLMAKEKGKNILLQAAGRNARLGGWEVEPSKGQIIWSEQICAIYGMHEQKTVLAKESAAAFTDPEHYEKSKTAMERLFTHGEPFDQELKIITADGQKGWVRTIGEPVYDHQGRIIKARGGTQDITAQKRADKEIEFLALYDPLTHLPNRRLFEDRLRQTSLDSQRSGKKAALILLDLDNFKTVNDTLGHVQGDELLQQVATRLTARLRKNDTVARFGGDEFIMIVPNLNADYTLATERAKHIGETLLDTLRQPYQLNHLEHFSTLSLGITMLGFESDQLEELVKQADLSMYAAKERGRNQLAIFDPDMQAAINARTKLEGEIRHGIGQGQFHAYLQSQVNADNEILGAEVLARWRHPERGLVSPEEFIPIAEDTGLILEIGHLMLTTACTLLAKWANDASTACLHLSVNVSARQLHHPDFVSEIKHTLARTNTNPRRLILEVTETSLLQNIDDTVAKMQELGEIGVTFALDDFGTGYSSLYYLKHLPLTHLKIDRSFIRDINEDTSDAAIVHTILTLAQAMQLNVIAEGVETQKQLDFLNDSGCPAYQGFFFSKPDSIEKFEVLIK